MTPIRIYARGGLAGYIEVSQLWSAKGPSHITLSMYGEGGENDHRWTMEFTAEEANELIDALFVVTT